MDTQRTTTFDGDFRRNPKTGTFCAVCQKDIKPDAVKHWVNLGEESCVVIHPEDCNGAELKVPVGNECIKQIPKEFRV